MYQKEIVQKVWSPVILVPKTFGLQKMLIEKSLSQNSFTKMVNKPSKKCWLEKFSLKTICFSECWVPKIFCPKTILIQKFFVKKISQL